MYKSLNESVFIFSTFVNENTTKSARKQKKKQRAFSIRDFTQLHSTYRTQFVTQLTKTKFNALKQIKRKKKPC